MSNIIKPTYSGGTYNINYELSSDCSGGSISFGASDDWIIINGNSFTVESNPSEHTRTGTISTFIEFSGKPKIKCNARTITIEQSGGTDCTCDNIIFTEEEN